MELDFSLFAQRIAMLAILGGFVGALLFTLVHGAAVALSERLRARSSRLQRVAQARTRQQAILRAMPRG